jgi:hypothetical protein
VTVSRKAKRGKEVSDRVRIAKEKGRALALRAERADSMTVAGQIALAQEFAALVREYPDVYPEPPVSAEEVERTAQELKEADEVALAAEAEAERAEQAAETARRAYHVAVNEIARGPRKPEKPS